MFATTNNIYHFNHHHHQPAAPTAVQLASVPAWAAAPGYDASACFAVHRPILAERFRTKMCKNFLERGECPYVHRCMFAHGDAELRTTEQNVADRLFSEDAIRAFKRFHYEQSKARAATDAYDTCYTASTPMRGAVSEHCPTSESCSIGTLTPPPEAMSSPNPMSVALSTTSATASPAAASSSRRATVRRHDPYAVASVWHPLRLKDEAGRSPMTQCATSDDDELGSCASATPSARVASVPMLPHMAL